MERMMKKFLNMLFPSSEKDEIVLSAAFQEKKERRSNYEPEAEENASLSHLSTRNKGNNPFDVPGASDIPRKPASIEAPKGLVGTGIQSKRSR